MKAVPMESILLALTVFYVISSVLPIWNAGYWWVRTFDFPRVQMLVLGIACLITLVVLGIEGIMDHILAGLVLVGLGLDAYRILPYIRFAANESESAEKNPPNGSYFTLSLMSANVLMKNRDVSKLIRLINRFRPHMVVLLEPDQWWEQNLRDLENYYQYFVKVPQNNTYGMLLYAQFPFHNVRIEHFTDRQVPAIIATIQLPSKDQIKLICLHPRPPRPKEGSSDQRDAELIRVGKLVENDRTPVLVIGDLNDVAWSHTTRLFQRVSGLLDPRRGRGFFNTYPVSVPFFRYPLDHVFHSRHFLFSRLEVLSDIGSDHFPLFVELKLTSDPEDMQKRVSRNAGDEPEAAEIVARKR